MSKKYSVVTENPSHTLIITVDNFDEINNEVHRIMWELDVHETYFIRKVELIDPTKYCRGCYYDIGNQEAHYDKPYGCLAHDSE
jgi:hypothetical protein